MNRRSVVCLNINRGGDVVDKRYKLVYKWEMRKKDRVGMDRTGGKKKREINSRDKVRGQICREARGWMRRGRCIM